jgi:nicotinamidase-related amidase
LLQNTIATGHKVKEALLYSVLVLEMQKDMILEGSVIDVGEMGRTIVPNIEKLLDVARERKVPVIYGDINYIAQDPLFKMIPLHCVPGTTGCEVVDELKPKDEDYIVNIYRMNAFLFSNLEYLLRVLGVNTVIITGVSTNTGCLLTAMEAFQRGFEVIIASDGCTTYKEEKHQAALEYLKPFAKILTVDEVIDQLKR